MMIKQESQIFPCAFLQFMNKPLKRSVPLIRKKVEKMDYF